MKRIRHFEIRHATGPSEMLIGFVAASWCVCVCAHLKLVSDTPYG